jgi:hypothetical protein
MEVMLILTKAKPGRSTLIKVKRVLIWHPSIRFSFSSKCWSISFHPHRDEFIPGGYSRVWPLFGTGTHKQHGCCDVFCNRVSFWFQIRQGRHWRHSGTLNQNENSTVFKLIQFIFPP